MTIRDRIELARAGKNQNFIAKLESGWVVAFDDQVVEGYCLIMADPIVSSLNEMPESTRLVYLRDMARLGDALLEVTGATRINYETWCNVDPSLHTHVVPRYASEPEEKRRLPVGRAYDAVAAKKFDPRASADFITKMRASLARLAR